MPRNAKAVTGTRITRGSTLIGHKAHLNYRFMPELQNAFSAFQASTIPESLVRLLVFFAVHGKNTCVYSSKTIRKVQHTV